MTDYGYEDRQRYIRSSECLEAKRAALRERMHLEGKAFISEEAEAKRNGWTVFHAKKGWDK